MTAVLQHPEGGLLVLWGRRRVGKTRLLLEWVKQHGGSYFVADASTPALQRRYFAESVARRLPGFADVDYRDWRSLLARLATEAKHVRFRGPVVLDELPYLVAASPELPSVLQQWLDHDAREAGLVVALAGSSQRMMQGLVLDAGAPLYGRARPRSACVSSTRICLDSSLRPSRSWPAARFPGWVTGHRPGGGGRGRVRNGTSCRARPTGACWSARQKPGRSRPRRRRFEQRSSGSWRDRCPSSGMCPAVSSGCSSCPRSPPV